MKSLPMKAIKTRHLPATNTKPKRCSATTGEPGQRVIVSDGDGTDHTELPIKAALALCKKMGWKGKLVDGGFPDGSRVFVFVEDRNVIEIP